MLDIEIVFEDGREDEGENEGEYEDLDYYLTLELLDEADFF